MGLMRYLIVIILTISISGCQNKEVQPSNINDICSVFKERPDWHRASNNASAKWNAPVEMMMAIMYQESSFRQNARPSNSRVLGIKIPWSHVSSALGYAQALNMTWDEYRQKTGNKHGDRTNFADAVDFMGWYISQNRKRSKLKNSQSYQHYLAYHEGQGGFNRGTYKTSGKKWLRNAARKVETRRMKYKKQLDNCSFGKVKKKGVFDYVSDIKY